VKAMHPEIQGQWEFYYVKTCVSLVTWWGRSQFHKEFHDIFLQIVQI
jgi:hypothetical protein